MVESTLLDSDTNTKFDNNSQSGGGIPRFIERIIFSNSMSPMVPLLIGALVLLVYLTARNSGLYPIVFGDEWLYNLFSRVQPADTSPRPMYLFYALYGVTNYCGDAFLECARQINIIFFALSLPLIYAVCRKFTTVSLSIIVSLFAVFSPVNTYSAFFMPESMYFFSFWLLTWFVVTGYETKTSLMTAGAGVVLACMSMVKPHAVFLFPALIVSFFSSWLFDRNANLFKQAFRLSLAPIAAFFLFRLVLGYMLAGPQGLNIMGIDYMSYTHSMSVADFIKWMSFARHISLGHLLGVAVMFGVPLALIVNILLAKPVDCSESECKLRFLTIYAGVLLISLMSIIVLYSAKVSLLQNISIEIISMRHYNFMFPLLLIIAASSLTKPLKNTFSSMKLKLVILFIAGLAVCALIEIGHFAPGLVDSPELFAFHSKFFLFLVLGSGMIVSLILMIYRPRQGIALYLLIFIPLMIIVSEIHISQSLKSSMSASIYDQAGQFVNRYLGKDTSKLVVFGNDLADVLRTNFWLSTAPAEFFDIPNGQNIDLQLKAVFSDQDVEWVLLIGNYRYTSNLRNLYDIKERIRIPIKNVSAGVPKDYTLFHKEFNKQGCKLNPVKQDEKILSREVLEIIPEEHTPHTTGKFDPVTTSMVAEKGETGAVIYGPYVKFQPGCYEATYHVTAHSVVEGAVIGRIDISEHMKPGDDNPIQHKSLESVHEKQIIKLIFKVVNPKYSYEFRVWSNGTGRRISVKNIQVKKLQ